MTTHRPPPGPARPGPGAAAWRWVAHDPYRPPVEPRRPPVPRHQLGPAWRDQTPRYAGTPRWGLPMVAVPTPRPVPAPPAPWQLPQGTLARLAPTVTRWACGWSLAAAAAHALRYVVLAVYARRLAPGWLDATTFLLVWLVGLAALAVGAAAAVCLTEWLVWTRRRVFAPAEDPRRPLAVRALCLLPGVNAVGPVLLLREVAAAPLGARLRPHLLRRWWWTWIASLTCTGVWWVSLAGTGQQAEANRVLLAVVGFGVAGACAWCTRSVTQSFVDAPAAFTGRLLPQGIVDRTEESTEE